MEDANLYFILKARSSDNSKEIEQVCLFGDQFDIDINSLKKVSFHNLDDFDLDLLLLIVAVDYADRRVKRRQATGWGRFIQIDIPVSSPERWRQTCSSLTNCLNTLSGDEWDFLFHKRKTPVPREPRFLPEGINQKYYIIPYSDGMDSVLLGISLSKEQNQIRVTDWKRSFRASEKFRCVDGGWRVSLPIRTIFKANDHPESTYRTRSFKFLMLCALAAFWTNSDDVYLPENGQGILSPVLTPKGAEYAYLGSHPLFTHALAEFLKEALGFKIRFHHPNIWRTKGSVLKEAVATGTPVNQILNSKSCALDARQGFGNKQHCGICTNCLLRRVSLWGSGFKENVDEYYYSNLDGRSLEEMSAAKGRHREYKSHNDIAFHAIQSMERFANIENHEDNFVIKKHAFELSRIGFCSEKEAVSGICNLIQQHKTEWRSFLSNLSPSSWVKTKLGEIQ